MLYLCALLVFCVGCLEAQGDETLLFEGREIDKFEPLSNGRRGDHARHNPDSSCNAVDVREHHGGVVIPKDGTCAMDRIPEGFKRKYRCRVPDGCDQALICYKYVPPTYIEHYLESCDFAELPDFKITEGDDHDDFSDADDILLTEKEHDVKDVLVAATAFYSKWITDLPSLKTSQRQTVLKDALAAEARVLQSLKTDIIDNFKGQALDALKAHLMGTLNNLLSKIRALKDSVKPNEGQGQLTNAENYLNIILLNRKKR